MASERRVEFGTCGRDATRFLDRKIPCRLLAIGQRHHESSSFRSIDVENDRSRICLDQAAYDRKA